MAKPVIIETVKMEAKKNGTCHTCNKGIKVGEAMEWHPQSSRVWHVICWPVFNVNQVKAVTTYERSIESLEDLQRSVLGAETRLRETQMGMARMDKRLPAYVKSQSEEIKIAQEIREKQALVDSKKLFLETDVVKLQVKADALMAEYQATMAQISMLVK